LELGFLFALLLLRTALPYTIHINSHTHTYTHTYTHTHARTHARMHTHTHTHKHTHTHTRMHTHIHAQTYMRTHKITHTYLQLGARAVPPSRCGPQPRRHELAHACCGGTLAGQAKQDAPPDTVHASRGARSASKGKGADVLILFTPAGVHVQLPRVRGLMY